MKTNEIRVNADGSWTVETTSMSLGMLVQGGISGRIENVSLDSLRKLGINGAPGDRYNDLMDNGARVRDALRGGYHWGVRVIRKGHTIQ